MIGSPLKKKMKITSESLLKDLEDRTKNVIESTIIFLSLDQSQLNWKESPQSWSILECLEHLNRYGDFYIAEINKCIMDSKTKSTEFFNSGWIGNYFAISMLPKKKLNKMKTFKNMNPSGSQLNGATIDKFLMQQKEILNILKNAQSVDLTKTKTSISISKWIQLRLGDTLRVLIYHNERHILQAQKVMAKYSN